MRRRCASGEGRAGPRNDITDVAGVAVGHFQRRGRGWLTGTTVVIPPVGTTGGVDVRGGGPGTRETDLLDPVEHGRDRRRHLPHRRQRVRARRGRRRDGRARAARPRLPDRHPAAATSCRSSRPPSCSTSVPAGRSPTVPTPRSAPAPRPGHRRATVRQGTVGAGTGAHAAALKGGIGSASVVLDSGITVAALVVAELRRLAGRPGHRRAVGRPPRPRRRVPRRCAGRHGRSCRRSATCRGHRGPCSRRTRRSPSSSPTPTCPRPS